MIWWGGDPGELPIATRGGEFVNRATLARWHDSPEEVVIISRNIFVGGMDVILFNHVLLIPSELGWGGMVVPASL